MSTLVNLTPHAVTIGTLTVPPSGTIARVAVSRRQVGIIPMGGGIDIPIFETYFGDVTDLPLPKDGTVIIVSAMVRTHPAVSDRLDVASPGQLVRDASGRVIGCDGLDLNA
jgi:hypothetical protein